jgi:putative membrane protein
VVLTCVFVYDGIVRSLLIPEVRLPSVPGGLTSLTAILALASLAHAWYALGGRNTAVFFGMSAVISWLYEEVGVATGLIFGPYHYTGYLGAKVGEVPILIPLAWFMMIYPAYVIANLACSGRPAGTPRGAKRVIRLATTGAVVMTAWDLVIDPILSGPSVRAWIWETGGPYYGIPIHNYAGWLLTTFTVYLAYRAFEQRLAPAPLGPLTAGAAALPVATYGLMLVADLLSGVAPAGLAAIGFVVMGIPLTAAGRRLAGLRQVTAAESTLATEPSKIETHG